MLFNLVFKNKKITKELDVVYRNDNDLKIAVKSIDELCDKYLNKDSFNNDDDNAHEDLSQEEVYFNKNLFYLKIY